MAVVIAAMLAIFGIAVVIYPFIKARFRAQSSPGVNSTADGSWGTREGIYQDIRTLQLEYDLGRLEENDYQERLLAYRIQAAAAIRRDGSSERELDRSLEQEILALRYRSKGEHSSSQCGSCGRPIDHKGRVCPHCGAEIDPDMPGQREGEVDEGPLP